MQEVFCYLLSLFEGLAIVHDDVFPAWGLPQPVAPELGTRRNSQSKGLMRNQGLLAYCCVGPRFISTLDAPGGVCLAVRLALVGMTRTIFVVGRTSNRLQCRGLAKEAS